MATEKFMEAKAYFPLCHLHNVKIVWGFPVGCPFGKPSGMDDLEAMRQRGIATSDKATGIALLKVHDLCYECTCLLTNNRHVRALRDALTTKGQKT